MWEFLGSLLEKSGLVAVTFAAFAIAAGLAIRWLSRRLLEAEKSAACIQTKLDRAEIECRNLVAKTKAEESAVRATMRKDHEEQLHKISQAHAEEIAALHEERRKAMEDFADRLDKLQERRVGEMTCIVERVAQSTLKIETSLSQVGDTMDLFRARLLTNPS